MALPALSLNMTGVMVSHKGTKTFFAGWEEFRSAGYKYAGHI
jgi:hypothetical protein